MIRHQVYFDVLGSMKEDSASWRSVFAGLSVLRLVDSHLDGDASANPGHWAQLHSVRATIESVSDGDPIRAVLMNVLEEVSSRRGLDDNVSTALLAYGRALDYEASWGLATDVFATVAKMVTPEKNPRLAVEANIAAGGAARRNGDWETSARAYSQAAYIADTLGDRPGVLTVQVGIANTYMAKGNLPQAQTILDDVVMQARDQQLPEVEAVALHSRATLSHRQGEYGQGVKLAYQALNLTTNPAARDAVLGDVAAALSGLGMFESARDAHLILAATSQIQWVRWQATINLMELASREGMERAFDDYASELAKSKLSPMHRAYFLLYRGEGLATFGREDTAEQTLRAATDFATANEFHQIAFDAEKALTTLRENRSRGRTSAPASSSPVMVGTDLSNVIDGLTRLREAAYATSAKRD
jgi:tetratricopeptide (TPR) repeat protein